MKKQRIFSHTKLRFRIIAVCGSLQNFADKLGINIATLCKKLNGVTDFTTSEVYNSCIILGIQMSEILIYFFEEEVRENRTE